MIRKRRAVFLVEMLTVILMVGVGGTLMAVGLGSMLRSQDRVVEFGNRFARTNDFLRCLKRDVRMATTATLREEHGEELRQVLWVGEPPTQITYRFFDHHVERSGGRADDDAAKLWSPMSAEISLMGTDHVTDSTGVSVTVFWRRTGARDPEPNRQFDLAVRCAGELGDAKE